MIGKEYDMALDALFAARRRKMLAVGIIFLGTMCTLFGPNAASYKTYAITMPWGPVYLVENPGPELIKHEECHYERLQEMGAIPYYIDYFANYPEEELRCGQLQPPR